MRFEGTPDGLLKVRSFIERTVTMNRYQHGGGSEESLETENMMCTL